MKGGLQLVIEGGEKMMRTKRAVQVTSIILALIVSAAFLPTLANGSISTDSLVDFGNVVIGSSKTITLKITNMTDDPMTLVMTWSFCGSCSFSVSGSPIVSMQGGETVDVGVSYEAGGLGPCEGTLYVTYKSDSSSGEVDVSLRGNGVEEGEPDNPRGTIVIDGCDTGVLDQQYNGSSISALIEGCASGAANHGAYVSCVAKLANDLKKAGIISGQDKDALQRRAAQASIP
jgi:hypothetical protein